MEAYEWRQHIQHLCPEITGEHAMLLARAYMDIENRIESLKKANEELIRERDAQYEKLVALETRLRTTDINSRIIKLEKAVAAMGKELHARSG